jgi:hypothetical protein
MPCALAMFFLIPAGMILAIIGLIKKETPRKYCIIGLCLNLLWLLVVGFMMFA